MEKPPIPSGTRLLIHLNVKKCQVIKQRSRQPLQHNIRSLVTFTCIRNVLYEGVLDRRTEKRKRGRDWETYKRKNQYNMKICKETWLMTSNWVIIDYSAISTSLKCDVHVVSKEFTTTNWAAVSWEKGYLLHAVCDLQGNVSRHSIVPEILLILPYSWCANRKDPGKIVWMNGITCATALAVRHVSLFHKARLSYSFGNILI